MGKAPLSVCSALKSFSHFSRKRLISKLKQAVRANTAMSPVQPMRSSRWGQSVGMSTKLERPPQRMFCWSRLMRLSEEVKLPVDARSEDKTSAESFRSFSPMPRTPT